MNHVGGAPGSSRSELPSPLHPYSKRGQLSECSATTAINQDLRACERGTTRGKMQCTARGGDPGAWLQESLMLNVSPSADRKRPPYFAYGPEPTFFNEADHGFITYPLHPRCSWNNESWNVKWTFETSLLSEKTDGNPWR